MENPNLPENNPENNRQAAAVAAEGDSVSSDGLKGEDGERNSSGANRWPREETMALIKIRSEMDGAFRDISPKAPLWEQVSRKLGELGYERSAKKCKEKFENIYKYHRRTKESRSGKRNGKTYRFFDQLEALDPHPNPATPNNNAVIQDAVPFSVRFPVTAMEHSSSATSSYSSGGGDGDGEGEGEGEERRRKKKRRLRMFFEGLMREVLEKQESLQRKFMEVLDKCDQDRMAREQAWKTEELARIKKERELLAQERSIAAAKDEAVMSFIRKFAEKNSNVPLQFPAENNNLKEKEKDKEKEKEKDEVGNGINVGNFVHMSSSRWPKDEVEALIRLRTQLDEQLQQQQQQGNNNGGPSKGPLWEEVSTAMKGLGYDRSAKRCKEKWENINKYFKRMKEKNKRKPEDSKTCPYYHHLEAIYSKKPRNNNNKILDDDEDDMHNHNGNDNNKKNELKPEELLMHIMNGQEERQQDRDQDQDHSSSEDAERENTDQNHNGYQMVNNSPSSVAIMS